MTIRNPVEWAFHSFKPGGMHLGALHRDRTEVTEPAPAIRHIETSDLFDVLAKGVRDFGESRTDLLFIGLIYPLAGLVIAQLVLGNDMLPLLFPLLSGFALLGPIAAAGLYEMSKRREMGEEPAWSDAFNVISAPSFGAFVALALVVTGIFVLWLATAMGIYWATMGFESPTSFSRFIADVLTTREGWMLTIVGCGIGFLFALVVAMISVFAFPMLMDRKVSFWTAVSTSVRACLANPVPMAAWGLIVAVSLAVGTLPVLLGLIVVVPVLGHATWHLYRRVMG